MAIFFLNHHALVLQVADGQTVLPFLIALTKDDGHYHSFNGESFAAWHKKLRLVAIKNAIRRRPNLHVSAHWAIHPDDALTAVKMLNSDMQVVVGR